MVALGVGGEAVNGAIADFLIKEISHQLRDLMPDFAGDVIAECGTYAELLKASGISEDFYKTRNAWLWKS